MKKIAAALLLSTTVAVPAIAADEGFYIGAKLGRSNTGFSALSDKTDTVGGILAGYQFNRNLAVEGEFTGVGKFAYANGTTGKTDAFGVSAVGILPLADAFSVYGKLGVARTNTTTNDVANAGTNRTAATFGAGVQYVVNQSVAIRLGWDQYGASTATAKANSSVISAGALLKF